MTVWGLAGANSNSIFCDAGRFAIQLMYVWSPTCFRLAPLARLKSLPSPLPPLLSIRGFPASSLGDLRSPLTNTYHVCRGSVQFLPFRFAFGEFVGLVDRKLSESLCQPARPLDLERINFTDIRQAEMLLEGHASEIGPAAHLAKLLAPARFQRDLGPNRRPVALDALQPYVDVVARKLLWIIHAHGQQVGWIG